MVMRSMIGSLPGTILGRKKISVMPYPDDEQENEESPYHIANTHEVLLRFGGLPRRVFAWKIRSLFGTGLATLIVAALYHRLQ